MELGPPQVSLVALNELRAVLGFGTDAAEKTPRVVSSLVKESEPSEATAKTIQPATGFVAGARYNDSINPEGTGGDDQDPCRSVAGSTRGSSQRTSGRPK
jgi:hypothetical protein